MRELFQKFLNATDPTRDMKLAAFGMVILSSIFWLTWKAWKQPLTDQWVSVYYGLCTLVGLGGAGWSAVDKWAPRPGPPKPTPPTEPTEGELK